MATSPGAMGGLRMIRSLNTLLQDMGSTVLPGHSAIGGAFKVFQDGKIVDERTKGKVEASCEKLVHFCRFEANREQDCNVAKAVFKLENMGEYGAVDLPK